MANPNGNPGNLIRFPPGRSGNPGGKPEGARNRLQASFLYALAEDFDAHGQKAIESAREKDPMGYIRCVAALMPQKVNVGAPLEDMADDELEQAIILVRSTIAAGSAATRGPGETNRTDSGRDGGDAGMGGPSP